MLRTLPTSFKTGPEVVVSYGLGGPRVAEPDPDQLNA